MDNELDIFQINLHKAYAPTSELNDMLKNKDSFIVLIQEPVTRLGIVKGLNKRLGNLVQASIPGRPRAALFVSSNLNIHPLYHLCTLDLAVASIKVKKNGNDKVIVICSSYFPYDSSDSPPSNEFTK